MSIVSPKASIKSQIMDMSVRMTAEAAAEFPPFEAISGNLAGGALVICDHASNAIPPEYGNLGLSPESLRRHIAYDIGAAEVARTSAARLGVPAVLSTFSRLLIDPNRGADDPTLVMRYSDGAMVPGNATGRPDRDRAPPRPLLGALPGTDSAAVDAMIATGEPPAILSIHSFTPIWRGFVRPWKVGVLWDLDGRIAEPLMAALVAEPDLGPELSANNEPYDGALVGDTIDAVATARGLSNALIEIRQDLVAETGTPGIGAIASRACFGPFSPTAQPGNRGISAAAQGLRSAWRALIASIGRRTVGRQADEPTIRHFAIFPRHRRWHIGRNGQP